LSTKFPIVLSKENDNICPRKVMGLLLHVLQKKKGVESKARAYFWQTDVKFGRKQELNIKLLGE
jgi:hypothetical protein